MMWNISVFLLAIVAIVSTEEIQFRQCSENTCVGHKMVIDPCPEASSNLPCKIKLGQSASIMIEYTPEFNATSMISNAYWTTDAGDLPFIGLDSNTCAYTTCPVTAGNRHIYSYVLPIEKKFPARQYNVKWVFTSAEKEEDKCCFIYKIQLTNKKKNKKLNLR